MTIIGLNYGHTYTHFEQAYQIFIILKIVLLILRKGNSGIILKSLSTFVQYHKQSTKSMDEKLGEGQLRSDFFPFLENEDKIQSCQYCYQSISV